MPDAKEAVARGASPQDLADVLFATITDPAAAGVAHIAARHSVSAAFGRGNVVPISE